MQKEQSGQNVQIEQIHAIQHECGAPAALPSGWRDFEANMEGVVVIVFIITKSFALCDKLVHN